MLHGQSLFKQIDEYMVLKTQDVVKNKKNLQIPNFCSQVYKKHKREFEHLNRKGYMSLVNKIRESSKMISYIKTGKSLFENQEVQDYHIPILKSVDLRKSLQELVNKSQEEISVNASQENLALIQCLSPKKTSNKLVESKMSFDFQNASHYSNQEPLQRKKSVALPELQRRRSSLASTEVAINGIRDLQNNSTLEMSRNPLDEYGTAYNNMPYQQKIKALNSLKKSFDFPLNPAYLSRSNNKRKLKYIADYCQENQIAMSNNEEIIMNLDMSKLKHRIWRKELTQLYENKQLKKDEVEELIDNFKNFEKLNFSKYEIQSFIQGCNERQKGIEENKKQQNKKLIKNISSLLEDELSMINQVKKLKHQKEQARKESVFMHDRSGNAQNQSRNGNQLKNSVNLTSILKQPTVQPLTQQTLKVQSQQEMKFRPAKKVISALKAINMMGYRNPSQDKDRRSSRNSHSQSSFNSRLNITTGNRSNSQTQKGGGNTHQFQDAIQRIQSQKKAIEEERLREQIKLDKKRKDKLQQLEKELDNPYLLKQHKFKQGKRNSVMGSALERKTDEMEGLSDTDEDSKKKSVVVDILKDKNIKKKPLIKLVDATANINRGKQKNNRQLLKLIERLDLDRPLMLKEKLDIIWKGKGSPQNKDLSKLNTSTMLNESSQIELPNLNDQTFLTNEPSQLNGSLTLGTSKRSLKGSQERENTETFNLRKELDKKKQARNHLNNQQREVYNKLLSFLEKRSKAIINEERKFMNIIKIVIDGGWIIREEDFQQILEIVNFNQLEESKLGLGNMSLKDREEQNQELMRFFRFVIEEFGFKEDIFDQFKSKNRFISISSEAAEEEEVRITLGGMNDFQNPSGNILENINPKNSIQKEIAKDIILHKVHQPTANSSDGTELKYMFIIQNKALKEVEFVADFAGSENFILETSSGPMNNGQSLNSSKQDRSQFIAKKEIGPLSTELVARLRMQKNWKLKIKFRFTLKNPPIESQKAYLKKQLEEHKRRLELARKIYPLIPFSMLTMDQAEQKLADSKLPSFVDLEFEPTDQSVFDYFLSTYQGGQSNIKKAHSASGQEYPLDSPFDIVIHWRRPHEFLKADFQEGLLEPQVFYETIEPNDIKPGVLGDEWFLSAVAILAERPALIERLFITKEINKSGIYRVRLCKNGEWVTVTVDDFFPCYPEGEPIFAKCHANELWVIILEKAYAKLHGNYYLLKGGFVHEALTDLTGCPTINYDLEDEYVQHFIENGQFWDLIKHFDDEGYLLAFSTPGEGRWVDNSLPGSAPNPKEPLDEEQSQVQEVINSLPKGQAFTVVLVKDVFGNQLLNLRSSLQNFDWKGDWSEKSSKWTPKLRDAIGPVFMQNSEDGDGTFWMSYQDVVKYFKSLNVCRIRNWEEVRIKGKFIRVQDIEDPQVEAVISKWYYSIDLMETTKIFIGIHQEDERIKGVIARRPYLDIGLAILKRTNDGLELVDLKDFIQDRQCEIEVNLEPGSYIILPRTTGCTLKRPEGSQSQNIQLLNANGQMHELLDLTLDDIFRKFDMLLNQELTFTEFKGFCECIGKSTFTEKEFTTEVLGKYHSTQRGVTLKGFKDYFRQQIVDIKQNIGNDDQVWQWIENLGYDRDLYSVRSRVFILSMHSATEVSVNVRDAVQTDLDQRTNLLVIDKFGQELENKKGYKLMYTFSEQIHGYSYAVQNIVGKTVDITLDCSNSQSMLFSSKGNKITKRIEAGQTEFMMHSIAMPNVNKFVRSAKCFVKEVPSH